MAARSFGVFGRLWRGELSLAVAFWLCFMLGQFVLTPIAMMLVYVPISYLLEGLGFSQLNHPAIGLLGVAVLAYIVTCIVGVWRSATRSKKDASDAGVKYAVAPACAKFVVIVYAGWILLTGSTRLERLLQLLTA